MGEPKIPSVLSHSVQTTRLNVNLAWEEENISGDQVSEECIEQKYNANAHNDHAGNAARSLKQQQDRNAADNNIHFCERAGTQRRSS